MFQQNGVHHQVGWIELKSFLVLLSVCAHPYHSDFSQKPLFGLILTMLTIMLSLFFLLFHFAYIRQVQIQYNNNILHFYTDSSIIKPLHDALKRLRNQMHKIRNHKRNAHHKRSEKHQHKRHARQPKRSEKHQHKRHARQHKRSQNKGNIFFNPRLGNNTKSCVVFFVETSSKNRKSSSCI